MNLPRDRTTITLVVAVAAFTGIYILGLRLTLLAILVGASCWFLYTQIKELMERAEAMDRRLRAIEERQTAQEASLAELNANMKHVRTAVQTIAQSAGTHPDLVTETPRQSEPEHPEAKTSVPHIGGSPTSQSEPPLDPEIPS